MDKEIPILVLAWSPNAKSADLALLKRDLEEALNRAGTTLSGARFLETWAPVPYDHGLGVGLRGLPAPQALELALHLHPAVTRCVGPDLPLAVAAVLAWGEFGDGRDGDPVREARDTIGAPLVRSMGTGCALAATRAFHHQLQLSGTQEARWEARNPGEDSLWYHYVPPVAPDPELALLLSQIQEILGRSPALAAAAASTFSKPLVDLGAADLCLGLTRIHARLTGAPDREACWDLLRHVLPYAVDWKEAVARSLAPVSSFEIPCTYLSLAEVIRARAQGRPCDYEWRGGVLVGKTSFELPLLPVTDSARNVEDRLRQEADYVSEEAIARRLAPGLKMNPQQTEDRLVAAVRGSLRQRQARGTPLCLVITLADGEDRARSLFGSVRRLLSANERLPHLHVVLVEDGDPERDALVRDTLDALAQEMKRP